MEKSITPYVFDTLLTETRKNFSENGRISDEILVLLNGMFDNILTNALELIDSNMVTMVKVKDELVKSDVFIFQVAGVSRQSYFLFPDVNYCQCIFYKLKVLNSKTHPACKHFLAATLAYTWNKCRSFDVSYDTYKQLVKNIL